MPDCELIYNRLVIIENNEKIIDEDIEWLQKTKKELENFIKKTPPSKEMYSLITTRSPSFLLKKINLMLKANGFDIK
jgi:hypothetical protein